MIKVYIDNKIFIKLEEIDKTFRDILIRKYTFTYPDYDIFKKAYVNKSVKLIDIIEHKGYKLISLPPNLPFLQDILKEYKIEYEVKDKRVEPFVEFPRVNFKPREEQEKWLEELKRYNYNAILSLPTGSGKSALMVMVSKILSTSSLFVASKSSYISSYKNELKSFVEKYEEHSCEINSQWLKNGGVIKPYMYATIQSLNNPDIYRYLKGKVGTLIGDELHLGLLGSEYRKVLYSINPKYRIFLSATPLVKSVDFVSCATSQFQVTSDVSIEFNINYVPLLVQLDSQVKREAMQSDNFMQKKSIIANDEKLLFSVIEVSEFLVKQARSLLLFTTNNFLQEELSRVLTEKGITNIVFNSKTNKKRYEQYLKDFDNGVYRVLIGGASTIEALSLYKLSTIIDLDLSLSQNSVVQLVGRLKRRNIQVCDKDKVFIKLIYQGISENKYRNTILPTLKTMEYVKIHPTKTVNHYNILEAL